MAERRMFSKMIIDTDAFLDMPHSTQALYFHLAMHADDEGFVGNPKKIQKMIGANDDDEKLLIAKRFILTFESGIIVIKHWWIHNYIQRDRFKETTYLEEKSTLTLDGKKAYKERLDTDCTQSGYKTDTQVSIGKDSIELGKDNIEIESGQAASVTARKRFVKPSIEEITAYCTETGIAIDVQHFFDFYESKGWKVGNSPMKDWKASVRNWCRREKDSGGTSPHPNAGTADKYQRDD